MNDIIEHLKDKSKAQPFGLRTEEEQAALKRAGRDNCILYECGPQWRECSGKLGKYFDPTSAYVIKPDYQPDPEYVDKEILRRDGRLVIYNNKGFSTLPFPYISLNIVVSIPSFVQFHSSPPMDDGHDIWIIDVASLIREGHQVYARFVKESKCTNP